MAVVVEDHVHARGALEVGVEVDAVQAGRGVTDGAVARLCASFSSRCTRSSGCSCGKSWSAILRRTWSRRISEETAAAAGRIQ